jgi:ligand-binding sensor domain-containing protein
MSNPDYQLDLPVLVSGEDLPIPVTDNAPREEFARDKKYTEWHNIASQRHIRDLALDPINGDLWLATGGGVLHWFAGKDRFTRYASEHGLPGNSVFAIAVDGSGQVWASSEHSGLYYLKNHIWQLYGILGDVKVSYLTTNSTGKLWVGTANGIYAITSPERKPVLELPPAGFPPRAMAIATPSGSIAINNDNDIWLCNATGVHHYQNSAWIPAANGTQPDILTLALQGNNLWLGTFRELIRIDLTTNTPHKIDTMPYGEVTAITTCSQGVWVTCGGQVGFATENSWKPLTNKRFNTPITSLVAASDEEVWIGTHDGLWRGGKESIRRQLTDTPPDVIGSSPERFFCNLVQALSVQQFADHSILWIGTTRGLFRYNLSIDDWRRDGRFDTQDIRAIINIPEQETVWVASWSKGLQGLTPKNQLQAVSDISEPILALTAGSDNYWAVGIDGLYRYHNSTWTRVIANLELPVKGWLQSISQVVADHTWLGTSAGLLLYKPDSKQLSQITGSLGSADIRYLLAIKQGNSELVFVGIKQGLYIGNLDTWEPVSELENRQITALVYDDQILWVGTDRGLFGLQCQDNSWQVINEFNIHNSGLGENRVIAIAISRDDSGEARLWVGTACGLSCYSY